MKNCKLCGKPIVLVPSAAERAAKYGKTAKYYTDLFDEHTECFLQKREEDTLLSMRKARQEEELRQKAIFRFPLSNIARRNTNAPSGS